MIKPLFLSIIMLLSFSSIIAQEENSFVNSVGINITNTDLSNDVVLGEVTINPSTSGKAIVTFNGKCIANGGATIIVAASNTTGWGSNEGHNSLSIHNNDQNTRSFSHTMVYDVDAGSYTYYAIGRRWIGAGLTSIYGSLTVEFVPSDQIVVETTPVLITNIVIGSTQDIADLTINTPSAGKVELSFSGYCYSEINTMIGLSGSNTSGVLNANFYQDVYTVGDVPNNPFSQKLVYDVDAGEHIFYAVAELIDGTDGNISLYGNLVAKFIPSDSEFNIDLTGISVTHFNVTDPTAIDSVETTAFQDGIYVVRFNGECYSSEGDRIVLAASDTHNWGINNGSVSVEAVTNDYNNNNFSHSMAYAVTSGNYTYYAVGQAFVETGGDQNISLYATLSAVFYPNIITGINSANDGIELSIFPNPIQNNLYIKGISGKADVSVFSINGKLLLSSVVTDNQSIDLTSLTAGSYIVTVSDKGTRFSQKIIKN